MRLLPPPLPMDAPLRRKTKGGEVPCSFTAEIPVLSTSWAKLPVSTDADGCPAKLWWGYANHCAAGDQSDSL